GCTGGRGGGSRCSRCSRGRLGGGLGDRGRHRDRRSPRAVARGRARDLAAGRRGRCPAADRRRARRAPPGRRRRAGRAAAVGRALADRLGDAALRARIDAAVAAAIAIAAEPETDGSWRVTLAVPLETIRIALGAPRALAATGDRGPPVVVVEGAAARPAIGWT